MKYAKWGLAISLLISIVALLLFTYSDAHLHRNRYNHLPEGYLTQIEDDRYQDEAGYEWLLQPHSMNIFHQPDTPFTEEVEAPYPILENAPEVDAEYPNLKLLHPLETGDSWEAILQPDGTYLTTGIRMGTYNYSHPEGFWGKMAHFFLDMLPGFITSDYLE